MYYKIIKLFILLFIVSCSSQLLKPEDIYSEKFNIQYQNIYAIFKDGDLEKSKSLLIKIDDAQYSSDEIAKKYNLLGIINYSKSNLEQAEEDFKKARSKVKLDQYLKHQILLNYVGTTFRNKKYNEARFDLQNIDVKLLSIRDQLKFYTLKKEISIHFEDYRAVSESLLSLLNPKLEIEKDKYDYFSDELFNVFFKLNDSERVYLLERYSKSNAEVILRLAKIEIDQNYYKGEKQSALDILYWLADEYPDNNKVIDYVESYTSRITSSSKIESNLIGVVLPRDGRYKKYSSQVLMGLEYALGIGSEKESSWSLITKNDMQSPELGRSHIRDLVNIHKVAVIVGGLLPNLAVEQYLEAKNHGVLFISLSEINLPESEKTNLLVEISGSLSSQFSAIISNHVKIKNILGERFSALIPTSESNSSSLKDSFSFYESEDDFVHIGTYRPGSEHKSSVKNFLGIGFQKERDEELLDSILLNEAKDKGVIRRIQNLDPQIDYDWSFIPSTPRDGIQLISYLNYFNASGVKVIGGPKWNFSKDLLTEQKRTFRKPVYFLGNYNIQKENELFNDFFNLYSSRPSFLSLYAIESIEIIKQVLRSDIKNRDQLAKTLINKKELVTSMSSYSLNKDGLWIKNLRLMKISSGEIKDIN